MRSRIKLLDDKTINKIAAGEVVERPSSVVKELIENAIDANATSIIVEIKDGGKSYIRVTDNGTGIDYEQLDLAFKRHSTSKIETVEDLEKIITLGFRGEALASISSVSQVELLTKTENNLLGRRAIVEGGVIVNNDEVGCTKGTTIIVKNLFYNVPVRLKFLKSEGAEASNIGDIVNKAAIGNPDISFRFIKDNSLIMKTPGNGDILSGIYSIFGKEFMNSLFKLNFNGEDIKIKGYISKPSFTRGNRSHQYVFTNGRYVKSEDISRWIEDEYKTLISINRFPVFILFIDINPQEIDVNVHPNKTEIRFKDTSFLSNTIKDLISNTLKSNNIIPEIKASSLTKDNIKQSNFVDLITNESSSEKIKENTSLYIKSGVEKQNKSFNHGSFKPIEYHKCISKEHKTGERNLNHSIYKQPNDDNVLENRNRNAEDNREGKSTRKPILNTIGTLFGTYILAEDTVEKSFYLIDQHAAHERIMYERIKEQYKNENIVVQDLLTPEVINLTHNEREVLYQHKDIVNRLGFEFDEFGSNSITIRSVPMVFGSPNCKDLFIDLIDNLNYNIRSSYDLKLEKIMKIACTNAIKAGKSLHNIEVYKLIDDLFQLDSPFTCPHGRPILIKMTKYEIEKMFKRV